MDYEELVEKLAEENQKLQREVDFLRDLMDQFVKQQNGLSVESQK